MDKETLIKLLMNASELEESHTPIVAKFFLEDFEWSGIEEEKIKRVKDILRVIKKQTLEHERILNNLIARVKGSGENEF